MYGARLCEPWPYEGCCDFTELSISAAVTGLALEAASEVLWLATGQRFGNCVATFRPCRKNCGDQLYPSTIATASGNGGGYPRPTLSDGQWINVACGGCTGDCGCSATSEVIFPDPISIETITLDGEVFTDWALHNQQRLVRTDGNEWPLCQDWTVTGGPDTWLVEAYVGEEVPALGQLATGKLACEIARMCAGLDCELPAYVTSVVRQGVTIAAPADFLDEKGLTGVFLADFFITRTNPHRLQDRARAYSPDRSYV